MKYLSTITNQRAYSLRSVITSAADLDTDRDLFDRMHTSGTGSGNLAEKLFWLGSGSGRFQKSDQDLVKNRSDPQHWL
jgi:hypothetical protein